MTDRELLELAAKAVGIKEFEYAQSCDGSWNLFIGKEKMKYWNPLDDDGDAFRLAIRLHLTILSNETSSWVAHGPGQMNIAEELHNENYQYDAARLAIVRAAAEIGRAMP